MPEPALAAQFPAPTGIKQHAEVGLQQVGKAVEEPAVRVQLPPVVGLGGKHDLQRRVAVQACVLLVPVEGWRGSLKPRTAVRGATCSKGLLTVRHAGRVCTEVVYCPTWLCTQTCAWRRAGPRHLPAACSQSRSPAGGGRGSNRGGPSRTGWFRSVNRGHHGGHLVISNAQHSALGPAPTQPHTPARWMLPARRSRSGRCRPE